MKKKVVIAGSASLQEKIHFWETYWEAKGFFVLNVPKSIAKENFMEQYPKVHTEFFYNIRDSDILFIMNEDKKNIKGYIGAETFAEICFGVMQNLMYQKNITILLLQMPENTIQSYDEIVLWLQLGWITLYEPEKIL